MPNIASALKDEITRVARKEIRKESEGLKNASAQARTEISALKRRVAELEKRVSRLSKGAAAGPKAKGDSGKPHRVRFTSKGLISLRKRLGMTAADLGALVGVSAQTIYNWEAEKSQPRQQQVEAYASLRSVGKKEAVARLKELAG